MKLSPRSFQTKITLAFIFSMLFMAVLGNYLLYEYSINSVFSQVKERLLTIAKTVVLSIDADELQRVPLNKEGINTDEYKKIALMLNRVKEANPSLTYIYTMAKTDKAGVLQFIVDPSPVSSVKGLTAYPGDNYDASRFWEMLDAFNGPTVEDKLTVDEWGVTLSGYAPIYDRVGRPIAILGVDINADKVYNMQKRVRTRSFLIFLAGIFISVILGFFISKRVISPIKKLVEGTRKIAEGNLEYKIEVRGIDEIAELASSFNAMENSLLDSRKKLHEYFYRVVQAMVRSIEAKDHYTRGHSDRVSEYAKMIALEMGFSAQKAELLKEAAQLHDIGKLGIHEDILNKSSALSGKEWDVVNQHPVVGEEILKPIFLDEEMLSVVRSHHERYDGKGYPDGLKGDQVSVFAQIVSVADAYDAMTSSRAYRPSLSKEEAISRLKAGSGAQFNPKIVNSFIKMLGG